MAARIPLLADENVPKASVLYLRERGYDVVWISEVSPGASDPSVLARGNSEARLTFGFDLDLAERVVRRSDAPPLGLVLLRGVPSSVYEAGIALHALLQRDDLTLIGRITVVKGAHIRQRPFPSATRDTSG
jgi:predicted nuclease of predicted toxin-antitoxin system